MSKRLEVFCGLVSYQEKSGEKMVEGSGTVKVTCRAGVGGGERTPSLLTPNTIGGVQ